MRNQYHRRVSEVRKILARSGKSSALIVGANPAVFKQQARDSFYRENSNLYYLSGCETDGALLLIRSDDKTPLLVAPKRSEITVRFDGKGEDLKATARAIGGQLEFVSDPSHYMLGKLRGVETLHVPFLKDSPAWKVGNSLFQLPSTSRRQYPNELVDADRILGDMRMIKDSEEIAAIREAAAITHSALYSSIPFITPGGSERRVAAQLNFHMACSGASTSFDPIVVAGPAAAIIHARKLSGKLKKGELLVIDSGASVRRYAADITRTMPIGGTFGPGLKDIYEIVLAANQAAIAAVRPGIKLSSVYRAAAIELTRGLVALKVLKGGLKSLIKNSAYSEWCIYPLGHSLGLDVHDIGWFRQAERVLVPGMVFTIEPGLYFTRSVGRAPRCGVRIEDDVVVTPRGCEVITAGTKRAPQFPKDPQDLCALLRS